MGLLSSLVAPAGVPAEPVDVPEFVPTDTTDLTDRQIAELVLSKLESFEHMGKMFAAQAQASPLLKSFVPKL